jgi:uncharacterized cupin superfamily protein
MARHPLEGHRPLDLHRPLMTERKPYTVMDLEAMERNGGWHLVRRSLGLEAFGLNVVHIAPGASIPEHDETDRDQEEVFLTLRGEPVIVLDGREIPLPPFTFARVAPEVTRTVTNRGTEEAVVLIASAPRASGYEPMGWA